MKIRMQTQGTEYKILKMPLRRSVYFVMVFENVGIVISSIRVFVLPPEILNLAFTTCVDGTKTKSSTSRAKEFNPFSLIRTFVRVFVALRFSLGYRQSLKIGLNIKVRMFLGNIKLWIFFQTLKSTFMHLQHTHVRQ